MPIMMVGSAGPLWQLALMTHPLRLIDRCDYFNTTDDWPCGPIAMAGMMACGPHSVSVLEIWEMLL